MPPTTRRTFAAGLLTLPAALRSMSHAQRSTPAATGNWLLLGTDKGPGLYRTRWDAAGGQISTPELAARTARPDFLARHPHLPVVYTVNSVGGGKGAITAFRVDAEPNGAPELHAVGAALTHGDGPCAVTVLRDGSAALAANYSGGSVAAWSLAPEGSPRASASVAFHLPHPGVVSDRQDASHMHCVVEAPAAPDSPALPAHILACDLGADLIRILRLDFPARSPRTAPFAAPSVREVATVPTRPGAGPRHVAFHPNGRWFYATHELDCTLALYDWQPGTSTRPPQARLRVDSVLSTLPAHTPLAGNTACELQLSPDGRFLYACTRGVDEITTYRIDATTGLLLEQQRVSAGGPVPRYIAFDPTRRWLLACNQGSPESPAGNLALFPHDPGNGHLGQARIFAGDTPMFALWI